MFRASETSMLSCLYKWNDCYTASNKSGFDSVINYLSQIVNPFEWFYLFTNYSKFDRITANEYQSLEMLLKYISTTLLTNIASNDYIQTVIFTFIKSYLIKDENGNYAEFIILFDKYNVCNNKSLHVVCCCVCVPVFELEQMT